MQSTEPATSAPQCAFCQIVAGETAAAVVDKPAAALTIMDERQPGWPDAIHVLVLPRVHVETIDGLGDELAAALMTSVACAARAVRRVREPEGISVWQSNGQAAGQEVPHVHVHVHVLSRSKNDGLFRVYAVPPALPSPSDLKAATSTPAADL